MGDNPNYDYIFGDVERSLERPEGAEKWGIREESVLPAHTA